MSNKLSFEEALNFKIPQDIKHVAEITGFSEKHVRRCFNPNSGYRNHYIELALIHCVLERERLIEEKTKQYFQNEL